MREPGATIPTRIFPLFMEIAPYCWRRGTPKPKRGLMSSGKSYFLCGIGGSGMLPLALILRGQGFKVSGSDRALDQGRTAAKFEFLRANGISLHAQDGSGIADPSAIVVASAAVEATVPTSSRQAHQRPDPNARRASCRAVQRRRRTHRHRRHQRQVDDNRDGRLDPPCRRARSTIMNGRDEEFVTGDIPFASAVVGKGDRFRQRGR
ncbi:MAG: Mur ligase domain-containing protein [Alphaproteobacteria bacterium]